MGLYLLDFFIINNNHILLKLLNSMGEIYMKKIKIAYLLLGIGIGIILINALYSLYPEVKYKELSEEMIIERAEELGYISLKEKIVIEENIGEKDELEEAEIHINNRLGYFFCSIFILQSLDYS